MFVKRKTELSTQKKLAGYRRSDKMIMQKYAKNVSRTSGKKV